MLIEKKMEKNWGMTEGLALRCITVQLITLAMNQWGKKQGPGFSGEQGGKEDRQKGR